MAAKPQISFLIGSGFSRAAGLPLVSNLNRGLCKIDEHEIMIHTSRKALFLQAQPDPNRFMNREQRMFLQQFLEFYTNQICGGEEAFNYEVFFDFCMGFVREGQNASKIETFCHAFNSEHITEEFRPNPKDQVNRFLGYYSQLLASLLHNHRFTRSVSVSNFPPYDGFLEFIIQMKKTYDIKIHSLNHDLVLDWLGHHHIELFQDFSDGFELGGSPYYGRLEIWETPENPINKSYWVKLEKFANAFDTAISLFKLHGSVHNVTIRTNEGRIRIKTDYGIGGYYKEIHNPNTQKLMMTRVWDEIEPDILSGTTEKTLRYDEDAYYTNLFKHFEKNLENSTALYVIGYGFADSGVNQRLEEYYLSKGKRMVCINPCLPECDLLTKYEVAHVDNKIEEVSEEVFRSHLT